MKQKRLSAYLGLFLMTTIIGLSFMSIKIALQYSSAFDLLAHRFSIALITIILLLVCRIIKVPKPSKAKVKGLLLLSTFYPISFFLFQALGMQYCSASEAGIIFAILPILTLIAAQLLLKEQTTIIQKIGVLLSVLGIIYIIVSKGGLVHSGDSLKGIALLLCSVLSFTAYLILGKKIGVRFTAIELSVWITIIACIVFNAWSIISHLRAGTLATFYQAFVHTDFLGFVLYLGILSTVLTSFLTNYALPLIPASQIGVFNNLSPIFAVISGICLLDERLYSYHLIGGALVFLGIALTILFKHKSS